MRRICHAILFAFCTMPLFAGEVSAEKLAKSLTSNILKFQKDYEEQVFTVKGIAGAVKPAGEEYVLIIRYKTANLTNPTILCALDAESLNAAASIKEDSKISVKGLIELVKDDLGPAIIVLKKCSIS